MFSSLASVMSGVCAATAQVVTSSDYAAVTDAMAAGMSTAAQGAVGLIQSMIPIGIGIMGTLIAIRVGKKAIKTVVS